MYKVFVNDKPLFLTNQVQKETDFKLFLLESVDIKNLIIKIFQNKIQKAFLYHPDEKLIMKTLRAKLPVEKAGGGLVYNKNGEVLFILRNGKWDLPKGKLEKNEKFKKAAVREVEEECNVKATLVDKVCTTFHTYSHKNQRILKKTKWYSMRSKHTGKLIPQIEENIEKVEWLGPIAMNKAISDTYSSIRFVMIKFQETQIPSKV